MTHRVSLRAGRGSIVLITLILAWTVEMRPSSARGQDPPPAPTPVADGADGQGAPGDGQAASPDPQVLTRGPVHEAFASPVVHDPAAGPVIPKDPPAPIQEMPPDQKPSGQNIQWIPGYWGWDVSRNDYIWISGVWREPPPNSQWVPGYWNQVSDGHQWVPGTWIPVPSAQSGQGQGQGQSQGQGQGQPNYLPTPPQSLEAGPNTPQPGPNVVWTPGYWFWQGTQYVWRPGYWSAVNPNWIWVPAHYVWSPSGYLFVAGYWDLPMGNRGLMFAPVYYPTPVYAQANFAFTPSIGIVGSAVTANLFVQASTNQYLFGNFYAQNFVSVGISPWFSFTVATGRPAYYDPLFSFYAVVNVRQNPAWVTQVRQQYILRRDNVAMRPPATYIEQTRIIERNVTINRNVTVVDHNTMVMPLEKMAADPVAGRGLRLQRVSEAERHQIRQQVAQMHEFREQRAHQEREVARARAAGGAAAANRPHPMNLPHSPIAARHPAGSHPAAAQRSEEQRRTTREAGAERERAAHPSIAAPRTASREGAAAHRPAQGAERSKAQPRTGMSRPSAKPQSRQPAPARNRENEERRAE
jgi:WXXGXW repeat (2 copies)